MVNNYFSLILFALAMVAGPGPANFILLSTGLQFGLRKSIKFLIGIIISKQFIIWPVGLGLLSISLYAPKVILVLKYLSVLYILWLAWRISYPSISSRVVKVPPNLLSGLLVHPLNPKAWLMIVASFSSFTDPEGSTLLQTGLVALIFLIIQCVFHPIWLLLGSKISILLKDQMSRNICVFSLSFLTVVSVILIFISD